ncbi:MAG: tetratricopeptide repeat protein [Desulfuromonas sp.]|nr:tetratricopeptide repeat protein [Desulfuromonas sp.]
MNSPLNDSQLLALIKDYTAQLKQDATSEVFCQLADSYVKLGLVDSAVLTLQQGLIHHPRNVDGQLLLSALLANSEQYDEAVAGYERLLKQRPDSIDALLGLAQLNFLQANLDRAQFYLEQARLLRPEHAKVLELTKQINDSACAEDDTYQLPLVTATVAELYYRQGLTEKAVAVYKTLVHQQPQNQVFHARLKELQEQTVVKLDENSGQVERRLQSWLSVIQRRRKNV